MPGFGEPLPGFRPRLGSLLLSRRGPAPGIHPLAWVAPTAVVGENCSIGPFAVVGERVRIGRNAVIASARGDLRRRRDRRRFSGAFARRGARILPHRQSRDRCRTAWWWAATASVSPSAPTAPTARSCRSGVTVIEDDVEVQSLTSRGPRHGGRNARAGAAPRSTAWCRSATPAPWARTISSARRRAWRAAPYWNETCYWPDRWDRPAT